MVTETRRKSQSQAITLYLTHFTMYLGHPRPQGKEANPEDDQGLSCVRAGSFCELISLRVAYSSQITQDDGGIQMTQFIMITMMAVSQQGLGLMNQAQIPVWGCCISWSLAPWPCFFILLPRFGIIGPGLILHCPPSLQDIDLSLDLVVWWYKGEHMHKYTQFIQ